MAALDCSAFSKVALKDMLGQDAFKAFHADIAAFLAPKPKDYSPAADKVQWKSSLCALSTTRYPSGKNGEYVRIELNQGNGCLKKNAVAELIAHLTEVHSKMS